MNFFRSLVHRQLHSLTYRILGSSRILSHCLGGKGSRLFSQ